MLTKTVQNLIEKLKSAPTLNSIAQFTKLFRSALRQEKLEDPESFEKVLKFGV